MDCKHRFMSVPLALLAALVSAGPASAQDATFSLQIEADGNDLMAMTIATDGQRLRLDASSEISMIVTPASMLMIQHGQRSYLEFGAEQMRMMQQLMAGMPQPTVEATAAAPDSSATFERTGRTAQIGRWPAFEVRASGADGDTAMLWLSESAEAGLLDAIARMGEAMSSMPMFGQQMGMAGNLDRFESLAAAQGIPAGQIVRIVADDGGATITLTEFSAATIEASRFAAPADYEAMTMPLLPAGLGR